MDWFTELVTDPYHEVDLLERARLRFRLPGTRMTQIGHQVGVVTTWAREEPDHVLDLVDWTLHDGEGRVDWIRIKQRAERVEEILSTGASIYMVTSDGLGLMERIDSTALAQFAEATAVQDEASSELAVAWSKAYGLHPDSSDAWDHSIKALEAVLKPIVVPNDSSATLGKIVGELRATPSRVSFLLTDNGLSHQTSPSDTLLGLLRLVWPNPDRHQGPDHRTPSLDEARGVVQLAVVIVQWVRTSVVS